MGGRDGVLVGTIIKPSVGLGLDELRAVVRATSPGRASTSSRTTS